MKNFKNFEEFSLNEGKRHSDMSKEEISKKANLLKNNMPGYIGTDFAKVASEDDLVKMADLKDDGADIQNQMNSLRKIYKLK